MRKLMLFGLMSVALAGTVAATTLPHSAVGVVQQVDPAAHTVTLAHEPVKSLNWPEMTMQFVVPETALLERLPNGRRVAFEFVKDGAAWRIVNAIPLAQSEAPAAPGTAHAGMMGDMSSMHQMCMSMMGQKGGARR